MGFSSGKNKAGSWGNAQEDISSTIGAGVIGGSNGGEGAPGLVSTRSAALKPSTGVSYSVPDSAKPGTGFNAEQAPTYSSPSAQGIGGFDGYGSGIDSTKLFGQQLLATGQGALLNPSFLNSLGSFGSSLIKDGTIDWSAFDSAFTKDGANSGLLSDLIGADNAGYISDALPYLSALQSLINGDAETSVGQAIGAYVGTLIPVPVFGPMIGATLGNVLGGMFADEDYPYGRLQFSSDPNTDKFNITENYVLDGFPQGTLTQVGDSLVSSLNDLISQLNGDITGDINTVFGYGDPSHYAAKGWFAGDKDMMLNPEFQNLTPSEASVAWLRYNLQKGVETDALDFGNQYFEDVLTHSHAYTTDQLVKDLTAASQVGSYYGQRQQFQSMLDDRKNLDNEALAAFEAQFGPITDLAMKAQFSDARSQYWDQISSLLDQPMPEDIQSVYDSYMNTPDAYYQEKTLRDQYMADPRAFSDASLANDQTYASLQDLMARADDLSNYKPMSSGGRFGSLMSSGGPFGAGVSDPDAPLTILDRNYILGTGGGRSGPKPSITQRYADAPTRYENGQLQRRVAKDPTKPATMGGGGRGGNGNKNPLVWMDA